MFVIWWGTNITRKELGYVAEFCRICRELRPFRLLERTAVDQVYSLPTGPTRFAGHLIRCNVCGIELGVESPETPTATAEALQPERWSEAARAHAARIDLEQRRAEGKLSAEERQTLLREPFEMFEALAGSLSRRSTLAANGESIFLLIGGLFFAVLGGVIAALPQRKFDKGPSGLVIGIPMILVGLPLLIKAGHRFYTATRRTVRKELHPFMTRALAPLAPTVEELSAIIAQRRAARQATGRYLDAVELHRAIPAR